MNLKKPDHETNFYTELLDNFVNLLEDTHKIVDQKINKEYYRKIYSLYFMICKMING